MLTMDLERRLAIAQLLNQPDPADLLPRTHHLRCEGKPERFALLPVLNAVFVQQSLLRRSCEAS